MYIHTVPWNFAGFGRLVDYVQKEKNEDLSLEVYHNVQQIGGRDEIIEQFLENDAYRQERKNGVALYHEIISFSAEDREHLTLEVIEDLTRTYLEKRAPNALAYAGIHEEMQHLHIHIVLSGNTYHSQETTRLDKADFIALRHEIEAYQKEQYPELSHSIAYDAREREQATPKHELVSTIQEKVLDAFESSFTLTDVASKLDDYELSLYTYRGKLTGIILDGQKFRFRRLDIDPTPLLLGVHERSQKLEILEDEIDLSEVTFTGAERELSKALYTEIHDKHLMESEYDAEPHFQELLEIQAREKLAAQRALHEAGPTAEQKQAWLNRKQVKRIEEERSIWRESQTAGLAPDEYLKQQEIEKRQAEAAQIEEARQQEAAERATEDAIRLREEAQQQAEEARQIEAQHQHEEQRREQEEERRRQMDMGRGE